MHDAAEFVRRMEFAYLILLTTSRDIVIVHLCQWFEVFLKSAGYWTLWSTYLGAARTHTWGLSPHTSAARHLFSPMPGTKYLSGPGPLLEHGTSIAALGVFFRSDQYWADDG